MRAISIHDPPSPKLIEMTAQRRNWKINRKKGAVHINEDYWLKSKKFPIFAIADGVTLVVKEGTSYPQPSGAAKVAELFCRTAVKEAEKLYENFKKEDIVEIFKKANEKIGTYNKSRRRQRKTINYGDFDLFSTTAALGIIKDKKIYWGTICDSRFMMVDRHKHVAFISPDGTSVFKKLRPKNWPSIDPQKRKVIQSRDFRNKLDSRGKWKGYGVLNGEANAMKYVLKGKRNIHKGEIIFLFTDGFSPYFEENDFVKIFFQNKELKEIKRKINIFSREFIAKRKTDDNEELYNLLYDYAAERSLIAVYI